MEPLDINKRGKSKRLLPTNGSSQNTALGGQEGNPERGLIPLKASAQSGDQLSKVTGRASQTQNQAQECRFPELS